MKTNIKYNINNTKALLKGEVKRFTSSIPSLILMSLIIIIAINIIVMLDSNRGLSFNKTVAIVDEDKSLQIKIFLKNITDNKLDNILKFKDTNLQDAKNLLSQDEISAIIHIEKDTFNELNNGNKSNIHIYYRNKSDIVVNFMVNYLDNLIGVLNEGQTGAMLNWDMMKAGGASYRERVDALNGVFFDYVKSFITRDSLYSQSSFSNYNGLSFIEFIFTSILVVICAIFAYSYHADIDYDIRNGIVMRYIYNGFSLYEILVSKVLLGSVYITGFFITMFYIFKRFVSEQYNLEISKVLAIFIFSIGINLLVFLLYFLVESNIKRNIVFGLCILGEAYLAGFIVPIRALNDVIYTMRHLNIFYSIQRLLISSKLHPINVLSLIVFIVACCGCIHICHRKRCLRC